MAADLSNFTLQNFFTKTIGLKCKEESILMETLSVHCGVCQWSTILDSVAVVNLREVDKVLTYFLFTGTKMHP